METQARKIHPVAWAAGIAVILVSIVGIAAMTDMLPASMGGASETTLDSKATTPKARTAAPMQQAQRSAPTPAPAPAPARAAAKCIDCGVIESVREIVTKGEGSGLGAVGGAVAGGLLGSQVGGGRGQDVMTAVGAVGGAVAGHQVEKHIKSSKSYAVTVRLDDGSSRVISLADAPTWRAGDKVRIVNGAIQSNA
jgi:outer membrane lipoprotein SlyB